MKYYIDSQGIYLGGWDANPPTGAIEVPEPPQDARQVWDGTKWLPLALDMSDLLLRNNDRYEGATAALTADYPQLEKDTWPTQDKESRDWVSDPENAVTPWIDRAAFERGIDREDYLRRTLAKAEQFKIMSSFLTGRRQKYEDAIKQGDEPVLDYALTPELMGELQAVAATIMTTPIEQLREVIA